MMERREHQRTSTSSLMGKSFYYITCPFCEYVCKAYVWSVAGHGKRCPQCQAMHHHRGYSERKKE